MAGEKKSVEELTDEELLAEYDRRERNKAAAEAWSLPSAFINQFHVHVGDERRVRLTFGEAETPGGVPVSWRTSVTLTGNQALQLANFIWNQYEEKFPSAPETEPEEPSRG